MLEWFLDLIYPRKCIVCGEVINVESKDYYCYQCKNYVQYIKEDIDNEFFNKNNAYVKRNYGVFIYNEYMKDIIHRFKYKNHPEYCSTLSKLIQPIFDEIIQKHSIDVVIPIPLHKSKYKSRGYNQSELLAKKLIKNLNIKIDCKCLLRVKNTKPQNDLNEKERKNNLKKAFEVVDKQNVSYKRVLLIDDIYTTGSTVEAAAAVLSAHGSEVYSLCLAVAVK